jgi:hypothetical protein
VGKEIRSSAFSMNVSKMVTDPSTGTLYFIGNDLTNTRGIVISFNPTTYGINWFKVYDANPDLGNDVFVELNGGTFGSGGQLVVTGSVREANVPANNSKNLLLMKLDPSSGAVLWKRSIYPCASSGGGGCPSGGCSFPVAVTNINTYVDYGTSVAVVDNGGSTYYLVSGNTNTFNTGGTYWDGMLFMINDAGVIDGDLHLLFGETTNFNDYLNDVAEGFPGSANAGAAGMTNWMIGGSKQASAMLSFDKINGSMGCQEASICYAVTTPNVDAITISSSNYSVANYTWSSSTPSSSTSTAFYAAGNLNKVDSRKDACTYGCYNPYVPDFSFPATVCEGQAVYPVENSIVNPQDNHFQYRWYVDTDCDGDFDLDGDGLADLYSSEVRPKFVFPYSSTCSTATVKLELGTPTIYRTKTVNVTVTPTPVSDITYTATSSTVMTFSTTSQPGATYTWVLYDDDGDVLSTAFPNTNSVTYTIPAGEATYTMCLNVSKSGCQSRSCKTVCSNSAALTVDFTPASASPCLDQAVTFTNASAHGNAFEWYLDDVLVGTSSTTINITFDKPGDHVIKLIGKKTCGKTEQTVIAEKTYTVKPKIDGKIGYSYKDMSNTKITFPWSTHITVFQWYVDAVAYTPAPIPTEYPWEIHPVFTVGGPHNIHLHIVDDCGNVYDFFRDICIEINDGDCCKCSP